MSDNATDTTRPDATGHDATNATVVLNVADAAAAFGISQGAVRKRLERGQLSGQKVAGQWRVVLTPADATNATGTTRQQRSHATTRDTTDATNATRPDATAVVSNAARAQLEAIRDEFITPLVNRIEELSRETGRLAEAERQAIMRTAALEQERDELRAEVELLRAIRRPADVEEDDTGEDQRAASTAPPGREEPPESTPDTVHQPSHVAGWLRRLFGRP